VGIGELEPGGAVEVRDARIREQTDVVGAVG
jgi:hypothetical protein